MHKQCAPRPALSRERLERCWTQGLRRQERDVLQQVLTSVSRSTRPSCMTSTAASSRTRSSAVGSAPAGCAPLPCAASRCAMSFMTFAMRVSASVLTSANCISGPESVPVQTIKRNKCFLAYRAPRRRYRLLALQTASSRGLRCRACGHGSALLIDNLEDSANVERRHADRGEKAQRLIVP